MKLSRLDGEEWIEHHYSGVFRADSGRLTVYSAGAAMPLVRGLTDVLAPPIDVLWVLHTSRIGAQLGRYQSPPLSLSEAERFLMTYADFLENDARSDLWLHSRAPQSTIVFERHGLIYAYGPLDAFSRTLESAGLREGHDSIPSPHAHHYRALYDAAERALASEFDWTITALRPEDEQVPGDRL